MPDVGDAHWTFVDLPDGHTWEVWRQGSTLRETDRDLYGRVRATMEGYVATDPAGTTIGRFPTLDEAAYPLALRRMTAARLVQLERGKPPGRNPVVLALAVALVLRAVLALRGR